MEFPVIDVNNTLADGGPKLLGRVLQEAFSTVGFAYVVNHGVPAETIARMKDVNRRFFSLDDDVKREYRLNDKYRGFVPLNSTTLRTSYLEKVRRPNQLEGFLMQRELPEGHDDWSPLDGVNQIPLGVDDFKATCDEYVSKMKELSLNLVKGFAHALGIEEDVLLDKFSSPVYFHRLCMYPPCGVDRDPEAWPGSAPHSDYGFLTLVLQDNESGLQLQDEENNWIDLPLLNDENAFVLNAGDTLHRWSNGNIKATPHRVIHRDTENRRHSVVFFFDPSFHAQIDPSMSLPPKASIQPISSFMYGDYVMSRLNRNYDTKDKNKDY